MFALLMSCIDEIVILTYNYIYNITSGIILIIVLQLLLVCYLVGCNHAIY